MIERLPGGNAGSREARLRAANRRTALVLLAIAIMCFGGVIASKWLDGYAIAIGIFACAALAFVALSIGRRARGADGS